MQPMDEIGLGTGHATACADFVDRRPALGQSDCELVRGAPAACRYGHMARIQQELLLQAIHGTGKTLDRRPLGANLGLNRPPLQPSNGRMP